MLLIPARVITAGVSTGVIGSSLVRGYGVAGANNGVARGNGMRLLVCWCGVGAPPMTIRSFLGPGRAALQTTSTWPSITTKKQQQGNTNIRDHRTRLHRHQWCKYSTTRADGLKKDVSQPYSTRQQTPEERGQLGNRAIIMNRVRPRRTYHNFQDLEAVQFTLVLYRVTHRQSTTSTSSRHSQLTLNASRRVVSLAIGNES